MRQSTNTAIIKITLLFCFVFLSPLASYSQQINRVNMRLSMAPVKSNFKNDENLTIDQKNKLGFNSSFEIEYFFMIKSSFLFGLQHMYQHHSFKGYYDAPGHTYLFDETFPYSHDLAIQELLIPFTIKYSFIDEKAFDYSPYIKAGVGIRGIIKTYTIIVSDSAGLTLLDDKKSTTRYENEKPSSRVNSYITASIGAQKNFRQKHNAVFIELAYKYGISRYRYLGLKNSNDLLISNSSWAFTLGVSI